MIDSNNGLTPSIAKTQLLTFNREHVSPLCSAGRERTDRGEIPEYVPHSLVEFPACTIVYLSLTPSMTLPTTFFALSGKVFTETRLMGVVDDDPEAEDIAREAMMRRREGFKMVLAAASMRRSLLGVQRWTEYRITTLWTSRPRL